MPNCTPSFCMTSINSCLNRLFIILRSHVVKCILAVWQVNKTLPNIRSGLSNLEHLESGTRFSQNGRKRAVEGLNAPPRDFIYGRIRVQNTGMIFKNGRELLLQVSWELLSQIVEAQLLRPGNSGWTLTCQEILAYKYVRVRVSEFGSGWQRFSRVFYGDRQTVDLTGQIWWWSVNVPVRAQGRLQFWLTLCGM